MVKALDLSSNGRIFRVGSNPTSGNNLPFNSRVKFLKLSFLVTNLLKYYIHNQIYFQFIISGWEDFNSTDRHFAICNFAFIVSSVFICFALQRFAFFNIIIVSLRIMYKHEKWLFARVFLLLLSLASLVLFQRCKSNEHWTSELANLAASLL